MTIEVAFGNVIRKLRRERGLSQAELSELSLLDRVFISCLERGKQQPTLITIFSLAAAFGVTAQKIISETEILLHNGKNAIQKVPANKFLIPVFAEEVTSAVGENIFSGTVLIVEDEPLSLELLSEFLSNYGLNILIAEDGRSAINIYTEYEGKIDLVLMDIMLPDLDGITIYKEILQHNPSAKIIFISGYLQEHFSEILKHPFMQKPLTPAQLLSKIKDHIESDSYA